VAPGLSTDHPQAGKQDRVDGKTIDKAGLKLITEMIADLKASRYRPCPARRVYIPKANGRLRPLGIPSFRDKLLETVLKLILEAIYEPIYSGRGGEKRPGDGTSLAAYFMGLLYLWFVF
jgi:retron-type reverse transcriptase